jgi:alpha-L-fucosidase 2
MSTLMAKRLIVMGPIICLVIVTGRFAVHAAEKGPLPTLKASLTGASGLDPIREAAKTLRIVAPITQKRWDDAVPLGNGRMGGLLFGEGSTITLAVDRGDLWDEQDMPETLEEGFTFKNMLKLYDERSQGNKEAHLELSRLFDRPYKGNRTPTKLPGGMVEIQLDNESQVSDFILDCSRALGTAQFANGKGSLECFFSAVEPIVLIRVSGAKSCDYKLTAPRGLAATLGYPVAESGEDERVRWVVQPTNDKKQMVWVASERKEGDTTLIALSISLDQAGASKDEAIAHVTGALEKGWDAMQESHQRWWSEFWARSDVKIPDELIMRNYVLVRYLLGAGSRLGASPLPLQGVWTSPGKFPPWKGDYHHDLNTQMCYVSYLAAGHSDEGRCFLEFMWNLLPTFRKFARDFHDAPGAIFPSVMSHAGKPLTGWPQYALMPQGNCSWVGWMYYRHWLYTRDQQFLAERAYPFCKELGTCIETLLTPDDNGILKLAFSSSPESGAFWAPHTNSNYDHDSMVALYSGLAHMADELGKKEEAKHWKELVTGLGERWVDPATKTLGLAHGRRAGGGHRHMAHVMSIFPYGSLNIEGSDADREVIKASLDVITGAGEKGWTGYTHSWVSCILARTGNPEVALKYLTTYCEEYTTRNGFHVNASRKNGTSAFTLEGNFMAMEAVHEMLMQSWGGKIRVFPALPNSWKDVSFRDLHAEGGFSVSAVRKNGKTQWVGVRCFASGLCRIDSGLAGQVQVECSGLAGQSKLNDMGNGMYQVELQKGQEIVLRLDEE